MPQTPRPIRVAIESPYAGDVEANEAFAEAVCRFAVLAGYAPYAMHLHNTRFLSDDDPEERMLGIQCGLAWTDLAEEVWICLRPGESVTHGMQLALDRNDALAAKGIYRTVRVLTFTQEGALVGGWQGEGPCRGPGADRCPEW